MSFVMTDEFSVSVKDHCFMKSQPTFLFLTYLNLMNFGHVQKHVDQIVLNGATL